MSNDESTARLPDSAWTCFLCNAGNVGGHICTRCKRPGRALPSTNRPTAEEYCTATKATAAKHWHWHTTEHTSFRVGPHSADRPTAECNGKCRFSNYPINLEGTGGMWDSSRFRVIDPDCPKHAPTPTAEEVNAMRERLHAATMKAQAHSQEGMITATPTTAAVGTCNACEYPDSPENVVEVTLHVGNGLTFRLCRHHSRELMRKLREALR